MTNDGLLILEIPEAPKVESRPGQMPVQILREDGTWTTSYFVMPQDLQDELESYRAEMKTLREVGTPYWCIHDGRDLDHPAAYWKEDGFLREDGLEIQYKHGVMCRDCGGYLQEG